MARHKGKPGGPSKLREDAKGHRDAKNGRIYPDTRADAGTTRVLQRQPVAGPEGTA
jgi:hypothetical protein